MIIFSQYSVQLTRVSVPKDMPSSRDDANAEMQSDCCCPRCKVGSHCCSVVIPHWYYFQLQYFMFVCFFADFCMHHRIDCPHHSLYLFFYWFCIWKYLSLFPLNAEHTLNYEFPGKCLYSRLLNVCYHGYVKSEMVIGTALLRPKLVFLNYLALELQKIM